MQNLDLFDEAPQPRDVAKDFFGFLLRYAKVSQGRPFSSEYVTLAAKAEGIVFEDMRHTGPIFIQAAKEGYIRRSEALFRRSMGNGSLTPGWVGV
jgi:hypothetical protein